MWVGYRERKVQMRERERREIDGRSWLDNGRL